MYHHDPQGTSIHPQVLTKRASAAARPLYSTLGTLCHELPDDAIPVAALATKKGLRIESSGRTPAQAPLHTTDTFWDYLQGLSPDLTWAFHNLRLEGTFAELASLLRQGKLITVSDGSYDPTTKHGTASWILTTESFFPAISGDCITPGLSQDQSAYRAELSGLYASVAMANCLADFFSVSNSTICMHCDGESALNRCSEPYDCLPYKVDHYDLILAVRRQCIDSPLDWTFQHVKGHQDDHKNVEDLDPPAQLNCRMDLQAKAYLRATQGIMASDRRQSFMFEPWCIWLGDYKLVRNVPQLLLEWYYSPGARHYWASKRHGIPDEAWDDLDFEVTRTVMKESRLSRRHWVTKHTSGFCGTNSMMHKWNWRPSPGCPRCTCPIETEQHVWHCQGSGADSVWNSNLRNVDAKLSELSTQPALHMILKSRLQTWQTETPPESFANLPPKILNLLHRQDFVGWDNFVLGRPVRGWREIQADHYKLLGNKRTGKRWLISVLKKLQQVAWDLWEHRNNILHKSDEGIHKQLCRKAIRKQFELGTIGLSSNSKKLFKAGLEATLNRSLLDMRAWLNSVRCARKNISSRAAARDRMFNQLRLSMARFLHQSKTIWWRMAIASPPPKTLRPFWLRPIWKLFMVLVLR